MSALIDSYLVEHLTQTVSVKPWLEEVSATSGQGGVAADGMLNILRAGLALTQPAALSTHEVMGVS